MTKIRKGNKELKKQPLLNTKEKKALRHARKHGNEPIPFLPGAARV